MEIVISFIKSYFWFFPLAYLIGSIPSAIWIGRIFHGVDVREHGSGNAGATNVMRVLGVKTGIPVLLFDMLKGWISVQLMSFQDILTRENEAWMIFAVVLGILAVIGHIFPVFAGFRGGKGVATISGVCLSLHPFGTLSALLVFVIVLLLSKYVSLSSISAAISFPVWVIIVFNSGYISVSLFSIIVAILLIVTHKSNIRRLIDGKEKKASFLFRKE